MVKSSDCNCSLYGSSLLINGNELTSMCFVPPTLLLMFSNQSGIEDTTTDFFQYSDQTMSAQFGPAIASKVNSPQTTQSHVLGLEEVYWAYTSYLSKFIRNNIVFEILIKTFFDVSWFSHNTFWIKIMLTLSFKVIKQNLMYVECL